MGSAYAGIIEGISERCFPFSDYLRTSRGHWHDFVELYLIHVIHGDRAYYETLCPILESFGSRCRFSLFDLCRASLVTRGEKGGSRSDKPMSLKTHNAQKIFASHASHQKSQEWTWARLMHSKGCVVALGLTAEYGLLRLFREKKCRILDSATGVDYKPRTHREEFAWKVSYAENPAKTIESRLESGAFWRIEHGQRHWNLIPIYHPQFAEGRSKDVGYKRTLKFLATVI